MCVSHAAISASNTPVELGPWVGSGGPGIHMNVNRANFCNTDGGHVIANIKAICLIVVNISLGDYTWLT